MVGKVSAIIQARMGSSRLPGKAMMKLEDKSLLEHIVLRVKKSKKIDEIILATTKKSEDDVLVDLCRKLKILTFRGSEQNVLNRFYFAAKYFNANIIVRITADDPFKDPSIIDSVINKFIVHKKYDYVSNNMVPTFPLGLDVEVFSIDTLEKVFIEAYTEFDKEHVTSFIHQNHNLFNTFNFSYHKDLSNYRWTIDTKDDFVLAKEIYRNLYPKKRYFNMGDILSLLTKNPFINELNSKKN